MYNICIFLNIYLVILYLVRFGYDDVVVVDDDDDPMDEMM